VLEERHVVDSSKTLLAAAGNRFQSGHMVRSMTLFALRRCSLCWCEANTASQLVQRSRQNNSRRTYALTPCWTS
jgi:hypothetical protein